MPQWPGTTTPTTGNVGGGLWLLSAHSAHLSAAVNFIEWVTTNDAYQADLAPGLPAYAPAAAVWLANQEKSGYYASDIVPVVQAGRGAGVAGLGLRQVQPGGDLGGDRDSRRHRGQDDRLDAAELADRDHQLRHRRRLPGQPLSTVSTRPARARARRAPWRAVGAGYAFVAGYVILLAAFGVVPVVYGVYFAFTNAGNTFAGLSNFIQSAQDFRYLPAFEHIGLYLVIWLVALVVLVTGLALVLHQVAVRRLSALVRFLYYIPGALAGAASVLVWLFMLDPTVSPASSFLRMLGYGTFGNVIAPGHLAILFAMIAFWTGAGGWIVVMYGALNNIPQDIMEAARIDGAGRVAHRPLHPDPDAAQVDRVHGDPGVRHRRAAVRRAAARLRGQPRRSRAATTRPTSWPTTSRSRTTTSTTRRRSPWSSSWSAWSCAAVFVTRSRFFDAN